MRSSPLGSTHGRTTSGVVCHHRHWVAHTVLRRRAWHAIIALGRQTWSNDVRRGMPSLPMGSIGSRTASGVACHHRLWPAHTVERRQAWHAIITFRKHTRSNDVAHGMASPPLDSTHGQKRRVWHNIAAFREHTQSDDVGRGMPSSPLDSTHGRKTSRVACHHSPWIAKKLE